MVVVMIMGILLSMVAFKVTGRGQEARLTAANTQLDNFSMAMEAYLMDNGAYPVALADLCQAPGGLTTWKGPYIQKPNFKDPWGNLFTYVRGDKASHNTKSYDLWSPGPDGQTGTEDDLTNWMTPADNK